MAKKNLAIAGLAAGIVVMSGTLLALDNFPKQFVDRPQAVQGNTPIDGRYVDYSPEAFAAAADQKRVLYFWAEWCPTCSIANQDYLANAGNIPGGAIIFRVNYDKETELKKRYGITYQHTYIYVDSQGNEIRRWTGGGLTDLIANIQ